MFIISVNSPIPIQWAGVLENFNLKKGGGSSKIMCTRGEKSLRGYVF